MDSISSVQRQTFADWELLLFDDASTDGTRSICQDVASRDDRIRVFTSDVNRGAAEARNQIIRRATGRFVAFLDGDDVWYPDKLEKQLAVFERTGAALVYSAYDLIDDRGRPKHVRVAAPASVAYSDFLSGCPIGCLTAVYDMGRVGRVYMPDLPQRQDWGLWMRVLRRHDQAIGVPDGLAALRLHGDSLTANKLLATYYTWRVLRDEGGLGPVRAAMGVVGHLSSALGRRVRRPAVPMP